MTNRTQPRRQWSDLAVGRLPAASALAAWLFLVFFPAVVTAYAASAGPFGVEATLGAAAAEPELRVAFTVPAGHYLYASSIAVGVAGSAHLTTLTAAQPRTARDPFDGTEAAIFDEDFARTYRVEGLAPNAPLEVAVALQGCSHTVCYPPKTLRFTLTGAAAAAPSPAPDAAPPDGVAAAPVAASNFSVVARTEGFQPAADFARFLDDALAGRATRSYADRLGQVGGVALVLLVLVGGLLLNFTPCVLPLIPINLAVIGAGARAGSHGRGFLLGAVYGLGMALAYGALGLAAALAGVPFGALNASPWFNLAIALLFVALALAMFDVFLIDLTRFRTALSAAGERGGAVAAFFMGGVSALLAGACVAPVVIAVVVLASQRIAAGHAGAALLPFVLGLGMALPWPLAGAGLALLPKPGRWMTWVRNGLGGLVLAFAVYYGFLAWETFRASSRLSADGAGALEAAQREAVEKDGWMTSLPDALARAEREGKPVLVDFWATWCKNCLAMDRTTFRDPAVRSRFGSFVKVKVQAEDPSAPGTKALLDRYGIRGLPTYIVLRAATTP